MHSDPKRLRELPRSLSLRLLGSVPMGRIVFTMDALPAIRPINHVVVDGDVVMCCHDGAALLHAIGQVVAFEADQIDPETRTGWSVIVTGKAERVEADLAARYRLLLRPRVDLDTVHVVRIRPELVTGYKLIENDENGHDAVA